MHEACKLSLRHCWIWKIHANISANLTRSNFDKTIMLYEYCITSQIAMYNITGVEVTASISYHTGILHLNQRMQGQLTAHTLHLFYWCRMSEILCQIKSCTKTVNLSKYMHILKSFQDIITFFPSKLLITEAAVYLRADKICVHHLFQAWIRKYGMIYKKSKC